MLIFFKKTLIRETYQTFENLNTICSLDDLSTHLFLNHFYIKTSIVGESHCLSFITLDKWN